MNLIILIAVNGLMTLSIGLIVFIWLYFQPKLVTTKIGIVITILGIAVYILFYNQLIPYLIKADENQKNSEFLKAVIKLKEQQKFLQTKMLQIYFATLTIGLCLYLYEYVLVVPSSRSIFVYVASLLWISFMWFYLRPMLVAKQRDRLCGIIKKFENIEQHTINNVGKSLR
ncbi:hypothetical protein [Gelidibacter sp. F63206]|uniref:hypothetical protein n=1 Tax=Gelidibacter sp. F63206 TaxID=2926425 RepID=UPI001FF5EDE6|nr:hypothetical protein [Gelidibacter sp. F63206]MCK0114917.1 hypothetical protein [Gelidibacter sp. F63206]